MAQDAQAAAPPAKKSRTTLWVAIAVLVTGLGAGGAYWTFGRQSAQAAEPAPEPAEPPSIVALDPFVVNLADPGGARFLRITIGLLVSDEEAAKELDEDPVARMRVRSAILEMLSQQTAARLTSPEGKAELKAAIAARAGESAEHLKVVDVLFSEFIVQ
jgi:flagellar FliL protein